MTIGFVDRAKIEASGEVYRRGGHYWEDDFHLYLVPPEVPDGEPTAETKAELLRLKQAMADAHPDRGGTSEGFRRARARYVEAKTRADAGLFEEGKGETGS